MRIALVAMSGIRACDAELLRLGLTLPGFVERSKTIASLPSLGLLTLAALTPPEHEVVYIELPDLAELDRLPAGFDLAAISTYSAQVGEAYALAERFGAAGVPTVIGGPHVTALPQEAREHCDAVVVGEGEPCWGEVVADAAAGRLGDIYDGRSRDYSLEEAPVPAFERLDIGKYNRLTVQTSRGCPHRCSFCASSVMLTSRYKQKPVDKVVAEIDRIQQIWPRPFLEFADDNSFVDKAYWKELLGRLEGRSFRWFAETDLSVADDPELLDLMRRTGCAQVLIGLESPTEAPLAGLEMRSDWKRKRFPDYRDAIRTIQGHGVTVNGCFVIGLDGHTPEIFDDVFQFVRDTELYEVQATILTPFPGTPLYTELERQGRLLAPGRWERCTLFDVKYQPAGMTAEQLADGFKRLVQQLYSDEFTRWRRQRFCKAIRASSRSQGTS